MKSSQVVESTIVDAPPDVVYRVLADYEQSHAEILPKPYFVELEVVEGGYGAGTVINVAMQVFGVKRHLRMAVTEPDPGRVLVEEDVKAGVRTTFTVSPVENGARSRVEIATVWQPKAGLAGWLEGMINPLVARRMFRQELALLDDYVRRKRVS